MYLPHARTGTVPHIAFLFGFGRFWATTVLVNEYEYCTSTSSAYSSAWCTSNPDSNPCFLYVSNLPNVTKDVILVLVRVQYYKVLQRVLLPFVKSDYCKGYYIDKSETYKKTKACSTSMRAHE